MLEKTNLEKRIQEIMHAIDQSAAHHNGLIGRLNEAKEMLAKLVENECNAHLKEDS